MKSWKTIRCILGAILLVALEIFALQFFKQTLPHDTEIVTGDTVATLNNTGENT